MQRFAPSRLVAPLLVALVLSVPLAGCGLSGQARQATPAMPPVAEGLAKAEAPASASAPGAPGGSGGPAGDEQSGADKADHAPPASPATDRKIITTGSMEIEVISLDQALAALKALVDRNGGFFANRTVSQEANWRSAQVTIRVPAANFSTLHDGAVALGTVKRDEQQGEDVTRQWQDLEARLRIRKQEEQSLLQLMGKQAKLSDLLDVEKRLWEVREQIEVAEGELRYLRDQVTLATLTINLHEQVPVGVGKLGRWNLGYHFLQACHALATALRGLIVALEYLVVTGAVVWVPLLLIILWIRRRLRRAFGTRETGPPGTR